MNLIRSVLHVGLYEVLGPPASTPASSFSLYCWRLPPAGTTRKGPATAVDDEFQSTIDEFALAALPRIPYPDNNPPIAERVALGKLLFFDPILGGESAPHVKAAAGLDPYRSRANDMACATCHHPTFGFSDGRRLPAGVAGAQFSDMDLGPSRVFPGPSLVTGDPVGIVPRNSPSILNTAYNGLGTITPAFESTMFMDGRVEGGLEEQATKPIGSRDEMAGDAYGADPRAPWPKTAWWQGCVPSLSTSPALHRRSPERWPSPRT